jgi:homoserine kinase
MKNFIGNMANACLISSAFSTDNYKLFSRSLKDTVIEPVRSKLIPGFDKVKAIALEAGADGMTISGAGPAVFAITNSKKKAPIIEDAMTRTFLQNGIECNSLITSPSREGSVEIK